MANVYYTSPRHGVPGYHHNGGPDSQAYSRTYAPAQAAAIRLRGQRLQAARKAANAA